VFKLKGTMFYIKCSDRSLVNGKVNSLQTISTTTTTETTIAKTVAITITTTNVEQFIFKESLK